MKFTQEAENRMKDYLTFKEDKLYNKSKKMVAQKTRAFPLEGGHSAVIAESGFKINEYGEIVDPLETRAFPEDENARPQANLDSAFLYAQKNKLPVHTLKPFGDMTKADIRRARNYILDKRKA